MKVFKFVEQVKQEINKVSWPTRSELISATTVILLVATVCVFAFLLIDYTTHSFVNFVLNLGK